MHVIESIGIIYIKFCMNFFSPIYCFAPNTIRIG
jgi:hypothetical protein